MQIKKSVWVFLLLLPLSALGQEGIYEDSLPINVRGSGGADILVSGSDGDSSTTESDSGLELVDGKLTLLRGCNTDEIPKWDDVEDDWNCAADEGGGTAAELIGTDKDLRISTTCNTGFYYDLNGDDSQDAGEPCAGAASEGNVYNVLDYGAVADADLAEGYTAGDHVVADTPGQTSETDNTAAFTAASDAACDSGEPAVVYIPAGDYRFGEIATTGYSTTWRVDTDCDLTIRGAGRGKTRLLPGTQDGQSIISLCYDHGNRTTTCSADTASAAYSYNLIIEDLTFFDDDPVRHGYTLHVIDVTGVGGGTPSVGQSVVWDGTENGVIEFVSGSNIHVKELGVQTDPENGQSITNGTWTDASLTVVSLEDAEETHGADIRAQVDMTIRNVGCENIGDECFDIKRWDTLLSQNVSILHNSGINTPSVVSAGAFISLDGVDGALIQGNTSVSTLQTYAAGISAVQIATSGGLADHRILITGNRFIQESRNIISLSVALAEITNIQIIGNYVEVTGSRFVSEEDATITQAAAISAQGTYNISQITIQGNTIIGGFGQVTPDQFPCEVDCLIFGNLVDDTQSDQSYSIGLGEDAANVRIENNHFFGGDGGFMQLLEPFTNIAVRNNTIETNNDANEERIVNIASPTDHDCTLSQGLIIEGNKIDIAGRTSGGVVGIGCDTHAFRNNTLILNDGDGSNNYAVQYMSVIGNYIEAWTSLTAAIRITSTDTLQNQNQGFIVDNTILLSNENDDGIKLMTGTVGWLISGNRIEGAFGATGYAIDEQSGADFNRINDNLSTSLHSWGPSTAYTFDGADDVDPATEKITITAHVFTDGSGPFQLTGGSAPTGLDLSTDYWVKRSGDNDIQVFATASDLRDEASVIDITGDGSGTITLSMQAGAFNCAGAVENPNIGCDGDNANSTIAHSNMQRSYTPYTVTTPGGLDTIGTTELDDGDDNSPAEDDTLHVATSGEIKYLNRTEHLAAVLGWDLGNANVFTGQLCSGAAAGGSCYDPQRLSITPATGVMELSGHLKTDHIQAAGCTGCNNNITWGAGSETFVYTWTDDGEIYLDGEIAMAEKASAEDYGAGWASFYVQTASPNLPFFRNDDDEDLEIATLPLLLTDSTECNVGGSGSDNLSVVYDTDGVPGCEVVTPVTNTSPANGEFLIYDDDTGDVYKNQPMSGDASMDKAGAVTVTLRSAADCTAETGGVTDELCIDSTGGAGTGVWRCPSPGDCSGTTAWERVDDTSGGGDFTSFFIDGDDNDPREIEDGEEALFAGGSGITTNTEVGDTITIVCDDAVSDGSTKGCATFTAADFDDSSGVISIDDTTWASESDLSTGLATQDTIVELDTDATGGNLDTLVGAGDADALHTHDLKADLSGPVFTGDAQAVTASADDDDTSVATTEFVQTELTGLFSVAVTGFQIIIPNPDTDNSYVLMLPPFTGTMTRVDCEVFGASATSVTIDLCDGEDEADDSCGTSILGSPLVCGNTPSSDAGLAATGFVAYDKVSLVLTADAGTNLQLSVMLTVTVD
jgi:hypothetical protein